MDVLKYAHENGCPWDEGTCEWAAMGGHLDVLKYLHDNGCPWDEDTCLMAAEGGHLHVLQWARENGCPWSKVECYRMAYRMDSDEMKAWIRSQPGLSQPHDDSTGLSDFSDYDSDDWEDSVTTGGE